MEQAFVLDSNHRLLLARYFSTRTAVLSFTELCFFLDGSLLESVGTGGAGGRGGVRGSFKHILRYCRKPSVFFCVYFPFVWLRLPVLSCKGKDVENFRNAVNLQHILS